MAIDTMSDDERAELQKVIRGFFDTRTPEGAVREQMADPAGYDHVLWRQMAEQLGLHALIIPEEYGGTGYNFVELCIAMEEMGRALVVSPFFASCVMTPQLLLSLDDGDANREYLPELASGELIGTVALAEDSGSWQIADVATRATESAGGWVLSGTKSFVLDGAIADVVFVCARVDDRLGVFAVEAGAPGMTRTPLQLMDQTRKMARIEFDATPACPIGALDAGHAVEAMLDRCLVAASAEAVGGTARVLDMAVDYAAMREQFGRPIGSFQAIKHHCADMLVGLESSRSAVYFASRAVTAGDSRVAEFASVSKAFCVDTYLRSCGDALQIHGGIGFTWEHPVHLHLKRAKFLQAFLGSSDLHRLRLADLLHI